MSPTKLIHQILSKPVHNFLKHHAIVTEMALNGTTKYRISSVPPLNSCLDRLFGKVYDKCVLERKETVVKLGAQ